MQRSMKASRHERKIRLLHDDLMSLDQEILQESASKTRFHDISNLNLATPSVHDLNASGALVSSHTKENALLAPPFTQSPIRKEDFGSSPTLNDTTRIDLSQLLQEKQQRVELALQENVRAKEQTRLNYAKDVDELRMAIAQKQQHLRNLETQLLQHQSKSIDIPEVAKLSEVEKQIEAIVTAVRQEEGLAKESDTNAEIEEVALQEAVTALQKELAEKEQELVRDKAVRDGFIDDISKQFEENEHKLSQELVPLHQSQDQVRNTVGQLSQMLRQTEEELQMTREDLTSKLMQRAEFVAWHESIEETLENFKKTQENFQFFEEVIERNRTPEEDSIFIARFQEIRKRDFLHKVLQIIKKNIKPVSLEDTGELALTQKEEEDAEEAEQLEARVATEPLEGLEHAIGGKLNFNPAFASRLNVGINVTYFQERFLLVAKNKEKVYYEKKQGLLTLVQELRKYSGLIKANGHYVDNMIYPQFKAIEGSLLALQEKKGRFQDKLNSKSNKIKDIQAKIAVQQAEKEKQLRYQTQCLLRNLGFYQRQEFVKEIKKMLKNKREELEEKQKEVKSEASQVRTKVEKMLLQEAALRQEVKRLQISISEKKESKAREQAKLRAEIAEEHRKFELDRAKAAQYEAKLQNASDYHENARWVFHDAKSRMRNNLQQQPHRASKSSRLKQRSSMERSRQLRLNTSSSATSKNSPYLDLSAIRIDSPNDEVAKLVRRSVRGFKAVKPFAPYVRKYETVTALDRHEALSIERPQSSIETGSGREPHGIYDLPLKPPTESRANNLRQSLNMRLPNCDELLSPNKTAHTNSGLSSICGDENSTMRSSHSRLSAGGQNSSILRSSGLRDDYFRSGAKLDLSGVNLERERFNTSESRISMRDYSSEQSSACHRREFSGGLRHQHAKNYRISLKGCQRKDVEFFERINPLLEGAQFFKQYSQQHSFLSARRTFDPLNTEFPPQECGYSERFFALHQSLEYIEVRELLKPGMLHKIDVAKIRKPQLSKQVHNIIKVQQNGQKSSSRSKGKNYTTGERRSSSVASVRSSTEFEEKCRDCMYYPFSISLAEGRLELIASKFEQLKAWIMGVTALVKMSERKQLARLSKHISII